MVSPINSKLPWVKGMSNCLMLLLVLWRTLKIRVSPNVTEAIDWCLPSAGRFVTMPCHRIFAIPVELDQHAVKADFRDLFNGHFDLQQARSPSMTILSAISGHAGIRNHLGFGSNPRENEKRIAS